MRYFSFSSFFLCVVLFVAACTTNTSHTETTNTTSTPEKPLRPAPDFNADSAYQYIATQVSFGARYPNSEGHRKGGDYIIQKLESFEHINVQVQNFSATAFDGKLLQGRNIFASFNPNVKKRVLLAAHWDTRPFADQDDERQNEPILGANDGGSGVGILLELARTLSLAAEKPEIGVDFIFFDLEDYGNSSTQDSYCLGSQYWAKNKLPENYVAYYGILLDMVGAKNAQFAMEGHSMQFAPSVVKDIWDTAHRIGYGGFFSYEKTSPIIDDHYYVTMLGRLPMIDIIEYSTQGKGYFGTYWHTHDDNMDVIDKSTLKAVGQTLTHVLYNEQNSVQ